MESNDCKLSIQEKQQMPETAESCQEKKEIDERTKNKREWKNSNYLRLYAAMTNENGKRI